MSGGSVQTARRPKEGEREKVNLSAAFKSEFLRVGTIVKGNKVPVQPQFGLIAQNGKVEVMSQNLERLVSN